MPGCLNVHHNEVDCSHLPVEEQCPACVPLCQWWAMCDQPATHTLAHPVLGQVPICDRCRAKVEALQ